MPKKLIKQIKAGKTPVILVVVIIVATIVLIVSYTFSPSKFVVHYSAESASLGVKRIDLNVIHIKTPNSVKGLYMTACVASVPSLRAKLSELFVSTEINSVVIDIKDYSGTISIPTENKELRTNTKIGCYVSDIKDFIASLHDKGVYVIGRITVFQDPYYSKLHPELAVKRASDGAVWKDHKGLSFIDVSAKPYWKYISDLGHEAIALGFDELNFDYIRFPSDGDMTNISYPWSGKLEKKEALRLFFGYLKKQFRDTGVKLSADLFGMTTTNTDDLNIGQYLEYTLPYFDYLSPMVYPSHYPAGHAGYKNPSQYPYEVINRALKGAILKTTPSGENIKKIRPWLQDFDMGAVYTKEMVQAQIKAVYDNGLNSWMLWDPSNKYTRSALKLETKQ